VSDVIQLVSGVAGGGGGKGGHAPQALGAHQHTLQSFENAF